MTFWSKATQEQKLAQIDAGKSLGLTAKQIAMNLRAEAAVVAEFAQAHGRSLPRRSLADLSVAGKIGGSASRRKRGIPEIEARSAFSIFEGA